MGGMLRVRRLSSLYQRASEHHEAGRDKCSGRPLGPAVTGLAMSACTLV
jgi:hypothetical protein